jgi:Flp pilus assembly protein TadG
MKLRREAPGLSRRYEAVSSFIADQRGVLIVKLALLLPIMFLTLGSMVDLGRYYRKSSLMQGAADAASMAAARELSLTDFANQSLSAVALSVARDYVAARGVEPDEAGMAVQTAINEDPIEVRVSVTSSFTSIFGDVLGVLPPALSSRSVARVIGKPNVCVLALNSSEMGTLSLEQQAQVTGKDCAIYSNSSHAIGLKSKSSARLTATFICSRGGRDGGPGNFVPDPLVDCPSFEDPLAERPEPPVGACSPSAPTLITSDTFLPPGTYCGLTIANGARVTLDDGIFVFKDLPLIVKEGAALVGRSAGLFFSGANASFLFDQTSSISLAAPTTGPMAGLLIFASRSQRDDLVYSVLSDDARLLLGTIYVPRGELRIDATKPIADQSAYTAIVADKMRLYGGPHLVLNTNYDASNVPVPKGIRGAGQPTRLMN